MKANRKKINKSRSSCCSRYEFHIVQLLRSLPVHPSQEFPIVLITSVSAARRTSRLCSSSFQCPETTHALRFPPNPRLLLPFAYSSCFFFHLHQFPLVFLPDDMTQSRCKHGLQGSCTRNKYQQPTMTAAASSHRSSSAAAAHELPDYIYLNLHC